MQPQPSTDYIVQIQTFLLVTKNVAHRCEAKVFSMFAGFVAKQQQLQAGTATTRAATIEGATTTAFR